MKKLFLITIALLLFFWFPHTVRGQSSKDSYRALKKLEAKIQAGISYKEYGPALGDAKLEVNLFSESPEAKEKSRLNEIFNKSMSHYEEAGMVWRYQFAASRLPSCMVPSEQGGNDSPLIQQILRSYPMARSKVDSMGRLSYSDAIKAIWQEASEELKKASKLLN